MGSIGFLHTQNRDSENFSERKAKSPLRSDLVTNCVALSLAVDLHHDAVEGKALVARLLPSHRGGQEEIAALRPLPAQGHPGT